MGWIVLSRLVTSIVCEVAEVDGRTSRPRRLDVRWSPPGHPAIPGDLGRSLPWTQRTTSLGRSVHSKERSAPQYRGLG